MFAVKHISSPALIENCPSTRVFHDKQFWLNKLVTWPQPAEHVFHRLENKTFQHARLEIPAAQRITREESKHVRMFGIYKKLQRVKHNSMLSWLRFESLSQSTFSTAQVLVEGKYFGRFVASADWWDGCSGEVEWDRLTERPQVESIKPHLACVLCTNRFLLTANTLHVSADKHKNTLCTWHYLILILLHGFLTHSGERSVSNITVHVEEVVKTMSVLHTRGEEFACKMSYCSFF